MTPLLKASPPDILRLNLALLVPDNLQEIRESRTEVEYWYDSRIPTLTAEQFKSVVGGIRVHPNDIKTLFNIGQIIERTDKRVLLNPSYAELLNRVVWPRLDTLGTLKEEIKDGFANIMVFNSD